MLLCLAAALCVGAHDGDPAPSGFSVEIVSPRNGSRWEGPGCVLAAVRVAAGAAGATLAAGSMVLFTVRGAAEAAGDRSGAHDARVWLYPSRCAEEGALPGSGAGAGCAAGGDRGSVGFAAAEPEALHGAAGVGARVAHAALVDRAGVVLATAAPVAFAVGAAAGSWRCDRGGGSSARRRRQPALSASVRTSADVAAPEHALLPLLPLDAPCGDGFADGAHARYVASALPAGAELRHCRRRRCEAAAAVATAACPPAAAARIAEGALVRFEREASAARRGALDGAGRRWLRRHLVGELQGRVARRAELRSRVAAALRGGDPLRLALGVQRRAELRAFAPGWLAAGINELDVRARADFQRLLLLPRLPPGAAGGGAASAFLAEHVWEHLTLAEGFTAARQLFAALRPGGHARIAVPDWFASPTLLRPGAPGAAQCAGDHAAVAAEAREPAGDAACPARLRQRLADELADGHRVMYTLPLLGALLRGAGFAVTPLEARWAPEAAAAAAARNTSAATSALRAVPWRDEDGIVRRSARHNGRGAVSLIVDAVRPRDTA